MDGNQEMLVQVAEWKTLHWLRHGFSTRKGGVSTAYRPAHEAPSPEQDGSGSFAEGELNLGWTKDDDPRKVMENRRRLVSAVCGPGNACPPLITVKQVHSASSLVVSGADGVSSLVSNDGRALLEADGLMTDATGILLGIQTADCVPVLVVDTRLQAVACFHAGWRGAAARIVEQGIRKMTAEFGSRPTDLLAAVGPSIGKCCYSVGEEILETFTARFSYGEQLFCRDIEKRAPLYLDLWSANRRQLTDAGVPASGITVVGECTGCARQPGRRKYFSHRCERGVTGRMMSIIGTGCARPN